MKIPLNPSRISALAANLVDMSYSEVPELQLSCMVPNLGTMIVMAIRVVEFSSGGVQN